MSDSNQVKNYTQGHLREMIKLKYRQWYTYRQIQKQLWIWSTRTVHKRVHSKDTASKSSAPHTTTSKYTLEQLYLLYVTRVYTHASIDECEDQLYKQWVHIPRSTIAYYLKSWWLTKKAKRVIKKFKAYEPWYLHIDITYWPKLNGKKYYIYVAIDRATRLVFVQVHTNKKAKTASGFLQDAMKFFPFKITMILTDRGKEFTLKNHKWKHDLIGDFDTICTQEWIEHRLTKANHPRTNWMVEKVNDTIKCNTIGAYTYANAEEMIQEIYKFMIAYNLSRKHWSIVKEKKWRTPIDALMYYIKESELTLTQPIEDFKTQLQYLSW